MTEIKFNPCPLCGRFSDYPDDDTKLAFYNVLLSDGCSNLSVSCFNCHLIITVYTKDYPAHLRNYDSLVQILAYRWNRLSARGSNVENRP